MKYNFPTDDDFYNDFAAIKTCHGNTAEIIALYRQSSATDTDLFGQSLIDRFPERTIAVVANPQTALLAALERPRYRNEEILWVATCNEMLTEDHLAPLLHRKVDFWPTARQYNQWEHLVYLIDTNYLSFFKYTYVCDVFVTFQAYADRFAPQFARLAKPDADISTVLSLPDLLRRLFFSTIFSCLRPHFLSCTCRMTWFERLMLMSEAQIAYEQFRLEALVPFTDSQPAPEPKPEPKPARTYYWRLS